MLFLDKLTERVLLTLDEQMVVGSLLLVKHLFEYEYFVVKILQLFAERIIFALGLSQVYGSPHVFWQLPIIFVLPALDGPLGFSGPLMQVNDLVVLEAVIKFVDLLVSDWHLIGLVDELVDNLLHLFLQDQLSSALEHQTRSQRVFGNDLVVLEVLVYFALVVV